MGRPRLNADQKLSRRFIFRLTEDEWKALHTVAAAAGRAPSTVVRQTLFTGQFPRPKVAHIDLQSYLELKKIGVNLNQLARKANSNRFPYGIGQQLQQLLAKQQTIIKLLLDDSESEDR